MKTGYTIKADQKEKASELVRKIEPLMDNVDPRVRITALTHQMAIAIGDLAEASLPSQALTQIAQIIAVTATGVAQQINPFSVDY